MRVFRVMSIVVMVASSFAMPGFTQAAPAVVHVQAGAAHPTNPAAPYDFRWFYPSVVQVHRGQTVQWTNVISGSGGFHTVTFAKTRPPFFRTDEVPGTYARAQEGIVGSDCGRKGMQRCVLRSSTTLLTSGIPQWGNSPFEVQIDLAPGTYRYFCANHAMMIGTVQVVKDSVRLPSAAQIAAERRRQIRADAAAADAIFRADQRPVSKIAADGHREWRVLLGDSTRDNHVQIDAYMPSSLTIQPQDRVKYVFRDHVRDGVHTVSFPSEASGSRTELPAPYGFGGLGFQFSCDLDGATSGMRGIAGPPWGVLIDCPATLEFLVAPWLVEARRAPGDQVVTRATLHDSAILAARRVPAPFRTLPDTGRSLASSFEAVFPTSGTFTFECNIHVDAMTGSVDVASA